MSLSVVILTDQQPEESEEEVPPPPPRYPDYLHIENVIRDGELSSLILRLLLLLLLLLLTASPTCTPPSGHIKFFGVPKLGAYLALPITYASGLHDDGIGVTVVATDDATEGGPPPAEGEASGETAATEEAPPVEGGGGSSSNNGAPPAPVISKVTKKVEMVLGLDTQGQARKFTNDEVRCSSMSSSSAGGDTRRDEGSSRIPITLGDLI